MRMKARARVKGDKEHTKDQERGSKNNTERIRLGWL